jgi:hypothetical protein
MIYVFYALISAMIIGLAAMYTRPWKKVRAASESLVETHHITRVRMHPIRCPVCKNPLEDRDLVIYSKKGNWQSDSAHASCLVLIRHPDGSTTRVDGKPVAASEQGWPLLLTEAEWEAFSKDVETQKIIPLSLPQDMTKLVVD